MAETHLLMFVVPFAMNVWWTKSWLMEPIRSRWRFGVAAFAGTIIWVYLAFAATRAVDASGGVQLVYGSTALAYICAFMALVSFVSTIFGLLVWTEETGENAVETMRDASRGQWGD